MDEYFIVYGKEGEQTLRACNKEELEATLPRLLTNSINIASYHVHVIKGRKVPIGVATKVIDDEEQPDGVKMEVVKAWEQQ